MTRGRSGDRSGPRGPADTRARPALRVAFSSDAPEHEEPAAIRAWLSAAPGIVAEVVPLGRAAGADADVVWLHGIAPVALETLGRGGPARLARGALLLTGGAAALPAAGGAETIPPNDVGRPAWDAPGDDPAPVLGHATFRGHPLFDGLGAGTYTWAPAEGEACARAAYVRPAWPDRGRVIAVERRRQALNPRRATIWEYDAESARTICIGAHLAFHSPDPRFRPHAQRLVLNALERAAGPPGAAEDGGTWRVPEAAAREDRGLPIPELPLLEEPLGPLEFRLRAAGPAAGDAPFTVAGRRAFVTGGEARGVDEVWAHPVRVATGPRVAATVAESVAVTPLGMERRLRAMNGALLLERLVVPREAPACLIEWQVRDGRTELDVEWTCDLRIASPYPPETPGPLRWRTAPRGLVVAGAAGDEAVLAFSRAPRALEVEDASGPEHPRVRVRARFRLRTGEAVRMAVVGGTGDAPLRRALAAADRARAITRARQGHTEQLLTDRLRVDAPDPTVAQAIDWAKHRLDSYLAEAPGVGRSLVAGYGSVAADGADGPATEATEATEPAGSRFAGDAAWAALACLATGEFHPVRDALAFLGRHQDLSGRIPDACTTSGLATYGAAHATPLYLLLTARYLAWTGDLRFVRAEWPAILRAYAFCRASGDDDGLIESTGAAAGGAWEGCAPGGLGIHAASVWTAALRELAEAAEAIGETGAAVELRAAEARARAGLERAFLVPETSGCASSVRRDGDVWRRNLAQTAFQAVPLLLGVVDPARMGPWLDAIAGDGLTTAWGVRARSAGEPGYDPAAPATGAVRPLHTGWVSWAEYVAGRAEAGYRHWRMNTDRVFGTGRGLWPGLLRGDEPANAGGRVDDAGATAMVALPFVYGLLGAEPDAPRGRLVLRPRPPAGWRRFTATRLRVGDASVTISYRREVGVHRIAIGQESGAVPLQVVLEPALPGSRLRSARVDGRPADLDWHPVRDRIAVPVQVVLDHPREVVLETEAEPATGG